MKTLKKELGFYCLLIFLSLHSVAQVNLVTQHNDLKRTGWNDKEAILTTGNVTNGGFGKVFSREVDDQIYTQPLIVSNLTIKGKTQNVVFVCTVNNSVYAFDADDSTQADPLWSTNITYNPGGMNAFRPPVATDVYCPNQPNFEYKDFSGKFGIVGTPVIDTVSKVLYVVARSVSPPMNQWVSQLHAISLSTGQEMPNSPVIISGSVPGTGTNSSGGVLSFDPQVHLQRCALMLYQNTVWIEWASSCDAGFYHGWVMGYDAGSLAQKYIYNCTANGEKGGIWMSGQAPAVDDEGFLYMTSGNGTTGSLGPGANANDTTNRGSSLLKLSVASGQMKTADFFTPSDYDYLNSYDLDYGVDGVMLMPDTHFSLSGSKEGYLYMIDNTAMGGMKTDNSNIVQLLNVSVANPSRYKNLHGSPVYYKNSAGQEYIYAWGVAARLQQFPFDRSTMRFDTLNKIQGNTTIQPGNPGGILSLSSSGGAPGTAIVWTIHPSNTDFANHTTVQGILQAFDASDVSKELWNSNMVPGRDSVGSLAKFVPPTIANGKVYMASFSRKLQVYGLNPGKYSFCKDTLKNPWKQADIGYNGIPGDVCQDGEVFTIRASGAGFNGTADNMHYLYQPFTGKITVSAQTRSVQNTNGNAVAGTMVRGNLDAGSPSVMIGITALGNLVFIARQAPDQLPRITLQNAAGIPAWTRLTVTDNVITGFWSSDSLHWTAFDSVQLNLGGQGFAGVAYSAYTDTLRGSAVVANVKIVDIEDSGSSIVDINLKGKNNNNISALLSWQLADNKDVLSFQIEKSSNDMEYQSVGALPNDGSGKYTFSDLNPSDGPSYYRVKVIYATGVPRFSNPVKITFSLSNLTIFPNPVYGGNLNIRNNELFTHNQPLKAELYSAAGQRVLNETIQTNEQTVVRLNLSHVVGKGVYFLHMINDTGAKQIRKIIIAK